MFCVVKFNRGWYGDVVYINESKETCESWRFAHQHDDFNFDDYQYYTRDYGEDVEVGDEVRDGKLIKHRDKK